MAVYLVEIVLPTCFTVQTTILIWGRNVRDLLFITARNLIVLPSLESAYFRNKFEPELDRFAGSNLGVGVISDMESQPITVTSHLGRFAVVVVGRLANLDEIVDEFLKERKHFCRIVEFDGEPDGGGGDADQCRKYIQGGDRERV